MRITGSGLAIVTAISLGLTSAASAQINPVPQPFSPYGRPALSPYLNIFGGAGTNYYMLKGREEDLRNPYFRPLFVAPDALPGYDQTRTPSYQGVVGYQSSAEDWVNQRIRETQLTPTGHPTGFLMPSPYFRMPNQRSFMPYHQGAGQLPR
ncbi:MAG: hypothetical protein HY289_16675 [Planctomycetes bacterium]|nr:hypothetical protein [Planctomycetota bacterium]